MSKKHGFNQNNDDGKQWSELAKRMQERMFSGYDSENGEVEPGLLEAANEMKKLFNAFTEAGFTSTQAMRLIAEIAVRGGRNEI